MVYSVCQNNSTAIRCNKDMDKLYMRFVLLENVFFSTRIKIILGIMRCGSAYFNSGSETYSGHKHT